jgi:hypothetical protein
MAPAEKTGKFSRQKETEKERPRKIEIDKV